MTTPLDGPIAKLHRARLNLDRFHRMAERAPGGDVPLMRSVKIFDPAASAFVLTVTEVRPVPLGALLLLDEAAHHLRSALDNLLFAIALADSKIEQTTTQFPLLTDPSHWNKGDKGRRTQDKWLAGVDEPHRKSIERRQPYHPWTFRARPAIHPLQLLVDLSDDNKHRVVQPGFVILDRLRVTPDDRGTDCYLDRGRLNQGVSDSEIIGKPLQAGTELARVPVLVTGPAPNLDIQLAAWAYIGFRNGIGCSNLRQAATCVGRIIRDFTPLLEGPEAVALWQAAEGRFKPSPSRVVYTVSEAS